MKTVPLWFPLTIALFFTAFLSAFSSSLHLLTLSPFLVLVYQRLPLERSLWIAAGAGLALDLFSSDLRFGIQALTCSLTTLILYRQRRHFFEDKPLSLCLFTWLLSVIATLIQWVLIPLSGASLKLSPSLLVTDLALLPIGDGLYAFFCFCCPLMLYAHIAKVGWKPFYKHLLTHLPFYKPKEEESASCN